MQFQVDVTSSFTGDPIALQSADDVQQSHHLLRQLLEVQREQLALQQQAAAAKDVVGRWRAFLERWQDEYPNLADGCRKTLPDLERAFVRLLAEMIERLEEEGIDNDFSLQEFLDRYGMRLPQLGNLLHILGPLAEAAR
jgi:hypothetical protein